MVSDEDAWRQTLDSLARRIEHHAIARHMMGEDKKAYDDLEPKGNTVREVIDHWLACRVTITDVGLGQLRWALTNEDVVHLAQHIEKWDDAMQDKARKDEFK